MAWFAASIVIGHFPRSGDVSSLSIEEDVVLISAESIEDARQKATSIGRSSAVDDESFTVNGVAAIARFVGVRKVISVCGPVDVVSDEPVHGAEITYLSYTVENVSELDALMRGERVRISLEE